MRAAAIDQRNSSGGHAGALCIAVPELRQEVLDDDLLHVTVAPVRGRDRFQRLDPFGARLADADEDAGRERDARAGPRLRASRAGARASCRGRRGADRRARRGAPRASRSSSPATGSPRRSCSSSASRQRTRVGVGEQPGLVEHEPGDVRRGSRPSSRVRGRAATRPRRDTRASGLSPSVNSASWQPSSAPRRAMLEHGVGREVRRVEAGRRLGERAVAAPVAAQHRQRDEHLGREGDPRPERGVTPARGLGEEVVEGKLLQRGVQHVGARTATLVARPPTICPSTSSTRPHLRTSSRRAPAGPPAAGSR